MNTWKRIEPTKTTKVGWRTIVTKKFVMPGETEVVFDTYGQEGQEFVAVIALTNNDKVIVGRQFRVGPEKIMDELPGGFVDAGEDPETAVRRELLEETGYETGELTYLGSYNKDTFMNARWHVYYATGCKLSTHQQLEDEEDIEIDLITIDQLINNAKTNNMTDATAVLMAYDLLVKV